MARAPIATYRVQLHPEFGFEAASGIVDYLAELGASHLYTSPCLQAAPGSTHGYDVVDPTRVNEELGGAAGHARLCESLRAHRLGRLLDIVPNHMAVTRENPWWWDVPENGPSSPYASYFDVDWEPPETHLHGKVLLPVLGDHYGRVLEAGELGLERSGGAFAVRYHEHAFPIAPRSLQGLLEAAAVRCGSDRLGFLADAFRWLPALGVGAGDPDRRHRDKEVLRAELARLLREAPQAAAAVDAVMAETRADADALDALLARQHYRLTFWRTAERELGYRRFFDINTLIGLRTESERVFRDTHRLVLQWVADGDADGLRIDHLDGVRDPQGYVRGLRAAAPHAWVVAEKILAPGERLPESWPVAGTTGYDFLNQAGGLFVDPAGEAPLTALYAELTSEPTDAAALVREKKHQVLHELLGSDVNRLAELCQSVCERHRRHRDYTRFELYEALKELAACFPVYRTYVRAAEGQVSEADAACVREAVEAAQAARPDIDPELLAFLGDVLLLRHPGAPEGELAMRFQQLTGPAMAKGVEDTLFYCFNRLVALNEVGGAPGRFGVAPEAFHAWAADIGRRWPRTLLATSTHDTKRSEDVRARLVLLSELPERWADAVRRWVAMNERHRRDGRPDRNAEYLLYQTLVGAWPIERERVLAYMEKAAREAKQHTSWTERNEAYESALASFVEGVLDDDAFVAELEAFVAPLVGPGRVNALAQTLVKLTAPGVPDLYQGTELWDLSLVDPDNRRPVDYPLRRRLLGELEGMAPEAILERADEGLPKLWVIRQALAVRRRRPELFGADAGYRPLAACGARTKHVLAFARGDAAVTLVPRLVMGLGGAWEDTELDLPAGEWHDELGGATHRGCVPVADVLACFPVALLVRAEADP